MDIEKDELPQGWAWARLDLPADINPALDVEGLTGDLSVSFVPMPAVEEESGRLDPSNTRPYNEVSKGYTRFQEGDLLFAKITPCMENGKIAIARNLRNGVGCGSTEFHVLRPGEGIDVRYLFYFLVQKWFRKEAEHKMTGSAGQKRVPVDFLQTAELPIAPSPEQTRIADKIDELFSDIDEGERGLRKVQALLKKHRQAVLKAAVTGELTRDWRDRHGPPAENGAVLLTRILAARRAAWEADQHAKAKAAGKTLKGEAWKAKYEEPISPTPWEIGLPSEWAWTAIQQLTPHDRACAYGVLQPGEDVEGGTPLVRVGDINGGKLDISGLKRIAPAIANQFRRTFLQGDEVLITLVGTIGRTAVAPKSAAGFNTARAVGVIPLCSDVAPEWVEVSLRSPAFNQALIEASHEVARKTLNLEDVRAFTIPLPPLAEQAAIIDRVEEEMSKIDAMEAVVAAELKRSARLRQSILKAAFTGKLVPQNPTDEPADALLARLRETRATPAQPKHRGRSAKAKAEQGEVPAPPRRRGRPKKVAAAS